MRWTAVLLSAACGASFAQTPSAPLLTAIDGGSVQAPPAAPPPPTSGAGDSNLTNGENRCDELGARCVGGLTFQASGYRNTGQLGNWEQEESPRFQTGKLLKTSVSGGLGAFFIQGGSGSYRVRENCFRSLRCVEDITSSGAMTLPAAESQLSGLTGRVAGRYYVKFSSDYESTGDGSSACTNDKHIQLGDYFTAYNTGFTSSNGGGLPGGASPLTYRDKWIRIEMVVDRYSAPTRMWFYVKNVTDNTPEISFNVPTRLANDSGTRTGFTEVLHRYRAGSCRGTAQVMFAMLAHWPSPTGNERIKGAPEVEGANYMN